MSEQVVEDKKFKTYLYSYRYKGKEWGGDIMAEDFEDAQARLSAIHFATVEGELKATIPANPFMATILTPVMRLVVRVLNIIWVLRGKK